MLELTRNIVRSVDKTRRQLHFVTVGLLVIALAAACGSPGLRQNPTPVPAQASATPSVTALPGTEPPVPTATVPATEVAESNTILIWWPDALYPGLGSPVAGILREEIENYQASRSRMVHIRVKRSDGVGGIYQTLRSGSVAAPSVMPDLAIMRRDDLVQAASAKLIEPVDMRMLAADDLFASALTLGQVRGTQYGVPYALEVQHAVYRTSVLATTPLTFSDLLQAKQQYLFPASAAKGVDMTLVAQYLASGGHIADDKGGPVLDREPLTSVLRYYEQALAEKIVTPQVLDYSSVAQFWPLFASGKASIVQVDSTSFLAQRASLSGIDIGPVPMPPGMQLSIVDGWMWVITTSNPDKQAKALDLLIWLLRADQQGRLLQGLGVLPSRRGALESWTNDSYADFARSLLQQPAAPPPDTINPAVAAALQTALEDVLLGRKSAETAAVDAVTQVGGK